MVLVSPVAAVRLEAANRWIAALPRDSEALVLAPHGHAVDEILRADVAKHGARFGFRRSTVDRLAFQLASPALARQGRAPGTSLTLAAVAARAVHSLLERGQVGRFAAIGSRPGFSHAAVSTLEELRGAGIRPAMLREALPSLEDLASILEGVERDMTELGLADRAEILALAKDAIESEDGRAPAPAPVPLLLLDLSPTQIREWELVAALVARAPRVLATVPRGDEPTIAKLTEILSVDPSLVEDDEPTTSRTLLARHLFEESGPEPRALDETVSLTSWPGEARECIEIARRIQEEAAAGVPFDRIAIFLRSPNVYRAHLEEALRRAEIPSWFARGVLRPDPAGRALLALLACAAEKLSARGFAEYLSLGQVPDPDAASERWAPPEHDLAPAPTPAPAPDEAAASTARALDPDAALLDGTLRAPWRWERLLVDAAVIGGRDRWARRIDGLIEEIALQRKDLADEDVRAEGLMRIARDLEHLRAFALPLIGRLAELPERAPWSTWLEHLREIAPMALRRPHGVLGVLAELAPLAPVGPVDLVVVRHVLAPRLRELVAPPADRPEGAVFVAPIEMARGLAFDTVFVPGLAERLFPPRILEDPLLPDESRRALPPGLLATQESRVQSHRLALRIAVGAARRRVALSWPRVDVESARARVPSFYGLEALRAMEGALPGYDEIMRSREGQGSRLGWPAPDEPERAVDNTEYDLAVLGRLRGSDKAERSGGAHYLLAANSHLARSLRARGRRWQKKWSYADGLVDPEPDELAALARHRMGARSYSPTALETFATCPYKFLLHALHRIHPMEEPEALETIDPLTRGALFHEIQFELLTALRDQGHLPLDPAHLETAFQLLDESSTRVSASWEERVAPAIPRIWSDGIHAIRSDLREWLRRSVEDAHGWVPHRFELSFGLPDRARPTADASSVSEPVTILDGILLRGSADLVERRADGTLRVTDHKTGKARVPAHAVIAGGKALQPLLYALAVEALLRAPVESGRLYYCTSDGGFQERVMELDDMNRMTIGGALDVIGRAVEEGFLPAAPQKEACRWCDYRPVCGPHEEQRFARKDPDRVASLSELRDER